MLLSSNSNMELKPLTESDENVETEIETSSSLNKQTGDMKGLLFSFLLAIFAVKNFPF